MNMLKAPCHNVELNEPGTLIDGQMGLDSRELSQQPAHLPGRLSNLETCNSLAPGRGDKNFKSIIFKLILQNRALSVKLLWGESHRTLWWFFFYKGNICATLQILILEINILNYFLVPHDIIPLYITWNYCLCSQPNEISDIEPLSNLLRHSLVVNKLVDHWDVVGALPVGTAPTTSEWST